MNNNKVMFIIAPVFLVFVLAAVTYIKLENSRPNENLQTQQLDIPEAFIPDSQEEVKPVDKLIAYKEESEIKRQKEKIKKESEVKSSDFFRMLSDDDDNNINKVNNEQTIDIKNAEELYEQTVMKKSTKDERTVSIQKAPTKPTSPQNTKKEEKDKVKELYEKAIENREEQSQEIETPKEAVKKNKRSRTKETSETGIGTNLTKACIHGDQDILSGATVRMRLMEDLTTKTGVLIPKNTIFYGIASITSERLKIKVENIKSGDVLLPTKFEIYDIDGIAGLNLPDNIKQELRKKTTESVIDQTPTVPPSGTGIIGNVISSTVNATKSVIKKSEQQTKVSLKTNYNIFIK